MADQAWLLAQQVEDPFIRAHAIFIRATTRIAPNLAFEDYEAIAQLIQEAAHLFTTLGDRMNYARCFNLLGEVKRMQQRYAAAKDDYTTSLQGLRAVACQSGVAIVLANLGWTVYHLGDDRQALACFAESIGVAYELAFPHGVAVALIGAAGVLTRLQHPQPAATLLGTADAMQKSIGMVIAASDEPDYEQTYSALQTQLGPATFDHCWQAGRRLTVTEAIAIVQEFC